MSEAEKQILRNQVAIMHALQYLIVSDSSGWRRLDHHINNSNALLTLEAERAEVNRPR